MHEFTLKLILSLLIPSWTHINDGAYAPSQLPPFFIKRTKASKEMKNARDVRAFVCCAFCMLRCVFSIQKTVKCMIHRWWWKKKTNHREKFETENYSQNEFSKCFEAYTIELYRIWVLYLTSDDFHKMQIYCNWMQRSNYLCFSLCSLWLLFYFFFYFIVSSLELAFAHTYLSWISIKYYYYWCEKQIFVCAIHFR